MTTTKDRNVDNSPGAIAQRLARDEEIALRMHRHLMASAYNQGHAEGFAKSYLQAFDTTHSKADIGDAEYIAALKEAHLVVINEICSILGVLVRTHQAERLKHLDLAQLVCVEESLLARTY